MNRINAHLLHTLMITHTHDYQHQQVSLRVNSVLTISHNLSGHFPKLSYILTLTAETFQAGYVLR